MNTRISPITLEDASSENTSPVPKKRSLLQIGVEIMDTILSIVLSMVAAIGLMWLNGKQHEFDELKNKSK